MADLPDEVTRALLSRWGRAIAEEQSRYAKALRQFKRAKRTAKQTAEIRQLLEQAGLIQPVES